MSEEKKLPAGMQMMMNMAIKSLGIDPAAILAQAAEAKTNFERGINSFDARLAVLEKMANAQGALLIAIAVKLEIIPPAVQPEVKLIEEENHGTERNDD